MVTKTTRVFSALVLSALAVAASPAAAQTAADGDAHAVFERAKQKFYQRLDGVENYTLYQAQNGIETILYYEREMIDGVPVYFLVPPHEWEPELQQAPAAQPPASGGGRGAQGGGAAGAPGVPPGMPEGMPGLPEGMPGGLPNLPGLPRLPGLPGLPGLPDLPGGLPTGPGGGLPDPKQALMQEGMKALSGSLGGGDEDRSAGIDPRMMDQLVSRAKPTGTGPCYDSEDLESLRDPESGSPPPNPQCHLFTITDLSGLDFGGESEGFTLSSIEIRMDARDLVSRRTTVFGKVEVDGYSGDIEILATYADFRQVDQMYEPYRRITRMKGMTDAMASMMDEKDLKEMEKGLEQLDDMEKMLAQLPPEQRKMVEQRMGKQLEMMRKMKDGGGIGALGDYQVDMEVSELLVNAGPPDVTGSWTASLAGVVSLDVDGEVAGIGGNTEAWQLTMAVPMTGGLKKSSVVQLVWKHPPGQTALAAGTIQGFGGISLTLDDGRQGVFQTDEDGAEIVIETVSRSRITGRFSFTGKGRISDGIVERDGTVTVHGTFETPGAPVVPDVMP